MLKKNNLNSQFYLCSVCTVLSGDMRSSDTDTGKEEPAGLPEKAPVSHAIGDFSVS